MAQTDTEARVQAKMNERAWLAQLVGADPLVTDRDHDLDEWDAFAMLTHGQESLDYLQQDQIIEKVQSGGIAIVPAMSPLGAEIRGFASDPTPPLLGHYVGKMGDVDEPWIIYED